MSRRVWYATAVATVMVLNPGAVDAQIADEVAGIERGTVRFSFETRPGVEICDQGIRFDGDQMMWTFRGDSDSGGRNCRVGLADVELDVRDGRVRNVEVVTDRDERDARAVDLGEVTPGQAAAYLLSLAYRGATDDGAEDAVFPAMLADVDEVWRELVEIAQDRTVHSGVRKNALFWLGQEAADAVAAELANVASDESEHQDIRNSAIFALSQRDDEESIPVLMDLARTGEHSETRRTAMFWLAQSDDVRVVRFFEDILLHRNQ